jgi:mannan endo-1,4-beta-mannosidase
MKTENCCVLPWLCMVLFFPVTLHAGAIPHTDSRPFFFGVALDGYPISKERLGAVEAELERPPEVVVFFLQWPPVDGQTAASFPKATLDAIWDSGAIPCLTWEPMHYSEGREITVPYQDILSRAYDPYLLEFATQAASWNRPFMIRFAHEMNIERYHWGTERADYGPESPRIYRQMFQYVVSIFQKAGAQNVVWVFCPNAESVPNSSYDVTATWNRIEDYYPGDAVVDVMGMDGYNWGTTQKKDQHGWDSQWRSFASIFQSAWETLRHLAPDKPIFVFETASVDQGGDRGSWVKNAFQTAQAWGLTGLVWFQVKKESDWRISAGQAPSCDNLPRKSGSSPHDWIIRLIDSKQKGLSP